jgi:hypothetical protein
MRHSVPHLKINSEVPECPACDSPLRFSQVADIDRGGKVYLLFDCPACGRGEMKFWRPEYQELADQIIADEL